MTEQVLQWKDRTECPDCDGALGPIFIIDQGHMGVMTELAFSREAPKQTWFSTVAPLVGSVKGKLCQECGRVFLYGTRN